VVAIRPMTGFKESNKALLTESLAALALRKARRYV